MEHENNTGSDVPISPRDGAIDFSKYSTDQLQDLRHSIDGRTQPQNLRNLLAELAAREAAGPDTVKFRDSREFAVRFTARDHVIGWMQGWLSRSPLFGQGVMRFEGADLVLVGWRRNWMGVALESELRIHVAEIHDVDSDGAWISFSAPLQGGRQRLIRCLVDDEEARSAILDKLSIGRLSPLSARAAQWRDFDRELRLVTPHAFVTGTLVSFNILVFAATVLAGSGSWEANPELLVRWGANSTALTTDGQAWRLVSSLFLHGGFVHLMMNMWALWGIGRLTERIYGNFRFAAIYALSGIAAGLSSIAWHSIVSSVGASGAIFGVMGACLAFFLRSRAHVSASIVRKQGLATTAFVLFNLVSGFVTDGIDNAAHVGGLLMGFGLGYLLVRPLSPDASAKQGLLGATLAVAFALLTIGVGVWQMHVIATNQPVATRYWAKHRWFVEAQSTALQRQAQLQMALSSGTISLSQFAGRFEPEVFAFWRDAHERLSRESKLGDQDFDDFGAEVTEFSRRRYEWALALLEGAKNNDSRRLRDVAYYLQSADQSAARLNRIELRAATDPSHALSESRVFRRLRDLPARFQWKCVGDSALPVSGSSSDGKAALSAAGCGAQRAFHNEEFGSLETILHSQAGKLVTFDDGGSELQGAFKGLSDLLGRTSAPAPVLSRIARWRRDFPTSDAPDLVESLFFREWAWQARGGGYAEGVSPQAWAIYRQRVEMAKASLDEAADKPQMSPAWYQLAISLGVDESKSRDQLRKLFDLSVDQFPDYYGPYPQMLRALLPKWGGSYEQIDDFIEQAQQRAPRERQPEMYARLYTTVAVIEGDEVDLFLETLAKWQRLKNGYEDMLKRYPQSAWLRNIYAGMACRANDVEVYRSVRMRLGKQLLPEAWQGKYSIQLCDERMTSQAKET
jgi:membrane associated rhomboid family serine protease